MNQDTLESIRTIAAEDEDVRLRVRVGLDWRGCRQVVDALDARDAEIARLREALGEMLDELTWTVRGDPYRDMYELDQSLKCQRCKQSINDEGHKEGCPVAKAMEVYDRTALNGGDDEG